MYEEAVMGLGILGGPVVAAPVVAAPSAQARASAAHQLQNALLAASALSVLAACSFDRQSYSSAMRAARAAGSTANAVLGRITGREHAAAQAILRLVARGAQLLDGAGHPRLSTGGGKAAADQAAANQMVQASCAFAKAAMAMD